jgi:hypothetical protein
MTVLVVIIALVAILVGYFLYKTKKENVSPTSLVNKEVLSHIEIANKQIDGMIKQIDNVLANAPELSPNPIKTETTPEELSETPLVEETYEISEEEFQAEVAAGSTEVVSEEVGDSKPVRKKKKRYYPKKK